MRTTLTLDPDVANLLDAAQRHSGRSMKQVVNDALRRALRPQQATAAPAYRLQPHPSALRPGYDLTGFNRLADDIEDEEILGRIRQPRDGS